MRRRIAPRPATLAAFAAVLVIPFYVGLVHWDTAQFLLYAAVAGIAIATGGYFDETPRLRGGLASGLVGALLWFLAIVLAGGIAYLIAWLF